MDIKTIEYYLNLGYIIAPIENNKYIDQLEDIQLLDLNEDQQREFFLVGDIEQASCFEYISNKDLVLLKWDNPYHINIDDLKTLLMKLNEEEIDISSMSGFDALLYFKNINDIPIFKPFIEYNPKDCDDILMDFLFSEDERIILCILNRLRFCFINREPFNAKMYLEIIDDILANRYNENEVSWHDDTLFFVLDNIDWVKNIRPDLVFPELEEFFKEHLVKLAERGHYEAMKSLGYQYYEDNTLFGYDPYKSLELLEKCYKISQDPSIARTLGYIYYYGRTNNGKPVKDKAFQYFAIGHFAGEYYEATYKLADCYVKGYGTPVNHLAAFKLVDKIYGESRHAFLNGRDGKFGDIALRLGSYYEKGISVSTSLVDAHILYLEARVAIKKRISEINYIGDKGVAGNIAHSIARIEKKLKTKDREIKNGGYVIDSGSIIRIENILAAIEVYDFNYLKIQITPVRDEGILYVNQTIGFSEYAPKIEVLVKVINPDGVVMKFNNINIDDVAIYNNTFVLSGMDENNERLTDLIDCYEVILIPQTLSTLEKELLIVSVSFDDSKYIYDYRFEGENIDVGDKVFVKVGKQEKEVTVVETKYYYADQIALPLKDLSFAYKK